MAFVSDSGPPELWEDKRVLWRPPETDLPVSQLRGPFLCPLHTGSHRVPGCAGLSCRLCLGAAFPGPGGSGFRGPRRPVGVREACPHRTPDGRRGGCEAGERDAPVEAGLGAESACVPEPRQNPAGPSQHPCQRAGSAVGVRRFVLMPGLQTHTIGLRVFWKEDDVLPFRPEELRGGAVHAANRTSSKCAT